MNRFKGRKNEMSWRGDLKAQLFAKSKGLRYSFK